MTLFVDTSALYPLLVRSEEEHSSVAEAFRRVLDEGRTLTTSNYVVLETVALLQRRIGLAAVTDVQRHILPLLRIHWVEEARHTRAVEEIIRLDRRSLSLVDVVSFLVMESAGIREVLALDSDFADRGFTLVPG